MFRERVRWIVACLVAAIWLLPASPASAADFDIDFFNAKGHGSLSQIQGSPTGITAGPVGDPALRIVSQTRLSWRQKILAATPTTKAGAHLDATAMIQTNGINDQPNGLELSNPVEMARDIIVDTPPGFFGNPQAVPQCKMTDFYAIDEENKPTPIGRSDVAGRCTPASQIGVAAVYAGLGLGQFLVPVYNLKPPQDKPAAIGFWTPWSQVPNLVYPSVKVEDGYRIEAAATRIPSYSLFRLAFVTLWGVPHSSVNQPWRWDGATRTWGAPVAGSVVKPFLSGPAYCDSGEIATGLRARSWNRPERWVPREDLSPEPTDCEKSSFSASLEALPTRHQAAVPSGAEVKVTLGFNDDPNGVSDSPLRDTTVVFPEGVSVSPSAANGLKACSLAEIGLKERSAPRCPDASKIATVRVRTPLLPDPLEGSLYVAEQGSGNPFGSLMAVYLHVEGAGVHVKLPGRVDRDPATGQITSTFSDNPQLPFTDLELRIKSGNRAPLVMPSTCGTFTTQTTLTPWSAPHSGAPVEFPSRFELKASDGCVTSLADRGFAPEMEAGSVNVAGGAHSEFTARFTRGDMEQEFDRIEVKTPEGFAASLRGIPYCSEAGIAQAFARDKEGDGAVEIANPSCGEASRVGRVVVGAGPGASPFYAGGKVYLAGPYRGGPLSLVFIVPAVAGPFDLGVQTVRAAIQVDRRTAQITTTSEEIPKILEGVPLKIKDIRVIMDREGFTLNPTSCEVKQVTATVFGTHGKSANVANRFQAAGCAGMSFDPRFNMRILDRGRRSTLRSWNPRTRFTLTPRPGDANMGPSVVTLPSAVILDQANIRTLCTRAQFAEDRCPERAIYGYARAWSPLLDEPVEGPVYMQANGGVRPLPDILADLRGQVRVNLEGWIDTVRRGGKGRLRNSFNVVPDVPVTRFELTMLGGKNRGLLVNSADLCRVSERGVARFTGANGKVSVQRPRIGMAFKGCKKVRRQAARKAARKKAARKARAARVSAANRSAR